MSAEHKETKVSKWPNDKEDILKEKPENDLTEQQDSTISVRQRTKTE
jgi:hypothetical protein